jgi:hypothetical protein
MKTSRAVDPGRSMTAPLNAIAAPDYPLFVRGDDFALAPEPWSL